MSGALAFALVLGLGLTAGWYLGEGLRALWRQWKQP